MPYNGSGVFSLVAGNPVVTGTVISSTVQNNTMSDIANNGLTNCLTKDGQQTPTADIPMGGFHITGLAAATTRDEAVNAGQIQDGGMVALASVTGTDTITATTAPAITAYAAGQEFDLPVAGPNTTNNVTLNITSIGAKNVTKFGGVGLVPGDLQGTVKLRYDGTQFQLLSPGAVALGEVGACRNVAMGLAVASTSASWAADEFLVKAALGGNALMLKSLSLAFNGTTTGAGGMDAGAVPTNGFLGVYVIAGLGKANALLGVNASAASKLAEVYAGANMPTGYTHSALISIVPTNASAQIAPCYQEDRLVGFPAGTAANGAGITGGTISFPTIVPFNAKTIGGGISLTTSNAGTAAVNWFSRNTQSGGAALSFNSSAAFGTSITYDNFPLVAPQAAFISTTGGATISNYNISVNKYAF